MAELPSQSKNEEELKIGSLFSESRFPSDSLKFVTVCLFAPFGAVLTVLRIFLGLHAFVISCALRKTSALRRLVLRAVCTILGLVIVEEGEKESEIAPVVVSNHVSPLDHTVLDLIQPCILPNVWELPNLLIWCFGYADLGAREGRRVLVERAKEFCTESKIPLLAFPEGAVSNGKRGLLKFNSWPFEVQSLIQPLVLEIRRPAFVDIEVTVLGSRWWTDILWFFFVPYSIFKIRWLKPMTRKENESAEDFALRVEEAVGAASGLSTTKFTSHDAVEYAKRKLLEERRRQNEARQRERRPRNQLPSAQLDGMAFKVKEMFPQVPLHVIRKDLERTGAVDLTASNIIENRLPFTPETADGSSTNKPKPAANTDPNSWKSVYEERKWAMIEENRRKYLKRKELTGKMS